MKSPLAKLYDEVDKFGFSKTAKELCEKALSLDGFDEYPASLDKHHSFVGGLATHTLEALRVAKALCKITPGASRDVVGTAVIFHDVGKLECYDQVQEAGPVRGSFFSGIYKKNERYFESYHIVISWEIFRTMVCKFVSRLPDGFVEQVSHCILAHHRLKENGSPVKPVTKEAWITHVSDSSSVTIMSDEFPLAKDYKAGEVTYRIH